MTLHLIQRYKEVGRRKASHNDARIDLLCPYCDRSKTYHSIQSLYIHFTKVHKDEDNPDIPKKKFCRALNEFSMIVDLGVILQ
ncbi:MAG: hypothetical protein ISR80_05940 [Nitrosopumilus sp.]|nr:hypothetical protein [Nitrosopumilus sp.]